MQHRKMAYGAILSIGCNALKSLLLVMLLPVMAKLVGPGQYGLYSMAMPAVMFAMAISDAGLGLSLARERDDQSPVWFTASVSLLAAAAVLALALTGYAWIASLTSGEERLFAVTAGLSLSLLFTAMSVVPLARLVREGDLTFIALGEFGSFLIGVSIALAMANAGFGVWALVSQSIATNFCRCCFFNLRKPFRPRFQFSLPSLKDHVMLGGAVGLGRLLDFGGRMIEMLIIGSNGTPALTGAFGFGNQVTKFAIEMINNTIWNVSYILALNAPPDSQRESYFKMTRVCAMGLFPVGGLVAISSSDIVHLLMGPEWAPAAVLIQVFAPTCALAGVAWLSSAVMLGRGVALDPLIFAGELVVLRILAVGMLPLFGWTALVYALGAAHVINAAHGFWMIERRYAWNTRTLIFWLLKPMTATAGAALTYKLLASYLSLNIPSVVVSGLVAAVAYVVFCFVLDGRRLVQDLSTFYRVLRSKSADVIASGDKPQPHSQGG